MSVLSFVYERGALTGAAVHWARYSTLGTMRRMALQQVEPERRQEGLSLEGDNYFGPARYHPSVDTYLLTEGFRLPAALYYHYLTASGSPASSIFGRVKMSRENDRVTQVVA